MRKARDSTPRAFSFRADGTKPNRCLFVCSQNRGLCRFTTEEHFMAAKKKSVLAQRVNELEDAVTRLFTGEGPAPQAKPKAKKRRKAKRKSAPAKAVTKVKKAVKKTAKKVKKAAKKVARKAKRKARR
jgi:hypothetical protein